MPGCGRVQIARSAGSASSEAPGCYFIVGILQEFLSTISGGKLFNVVETECRATGGAACIFRIDKQALEQ